ncbi:hypothetical protein CFK38_05135 [Brachybacterium vulturis]|uniref:Uncharacterized protein n=1 Tax=Brachybacterium vulturis TaxID=2017484 RepID=A0A291GKE0_9MICO|nr:hypothetical protein CFK38_05135 [Brachybacterium vulturis]
MLLAEVATGSFEDPATASSGESSAGVAAAVAFAFDVDRRGDFFLLLAMKRCSLDGSDRTVRRASPRARTVA